MTRRLTAFALCAGCFTKPGFDPQPTDALVVVDTPGDGTGEVNVAFVTSVTESIANLGSVEAADALCQTRAGAAGLPTNTYRAWLSSTTANATQRLGAARGWVRPDGRPFADTLDQLIAGVIYYPLRVDELGADHVNSGVATATAEDGALVANDCAGLTGNGEAIATGVTDGTRKRWTDNFTSLSCGNDLRYYCFGIDHRATVTPSAAAGRRAFISVAAFEPGSGISAADAICAGEAMAAGFPGEFRALLSTTTAPAASRFGAGNRWVRPDGVSLSVTDAELLNADVLTSLNVQADGTHISDELVWSGVAPGSNLKQLGTADSTCENWGNPTLVSGGVGVSTRSSNLWFRSTSGHDCSVSRRVYCLEL